MCSNTSTTTHSNNIRHACRPIFKGKVRVDNDLKSILQSVDHEKYMALPRDEGRKEAEKEKSVILQYFLAQKYWYCYLHALVSHNFRQSSPASVSFRGGFVRVEADRDWEFEKKMTKGWLSTHGSEWDCKTDRRSGCEIQSEESKWHKTDTPLAKRSTEDVWRCK